MFDITAVPLDGTETDVTVLIPFSGSVSLAITFMITLLQAAVVSKSGLATGNRLSTDTNTIAESQEEGIPLSQIL